MDLSVRDHRDAILRAMKITLAAACALLSASSLSAQYQYDGHVHDVFPPIGPVAGGTAATIEGEFDFSGLADPCGGPRVYIGGVAAQVTGYDETTIEIKTPPYSAGRFDVLVDRCGAKGALKNGFTYVAGNGRTWDRLLLPVYLARDLAGAFGSVWRTTLSGYNSLGDLAFTGHPEYECQFPSNNAAVPCFELVRHGSFTPLVDTDQHQPGRIVYIETGEPKRVRFNLRVTDVSRLSSSLGTELPVVYEDDAIGPFDQIVLQNIPLGESYRQKLRIYRIDTGDPATINIFLNDGNDSLGVRTVTMSQEPLVGGYLLYPGYVDLDLDRLPELAGHSRADIVISVPEGRYWAYVSVTNNDTQQVTHITP